MIERMDDGLEVEQPSSKYTPETPYVHVEFLDRPDWQTRAACKGMGKDTIFFPPSTFERKDEKEERERKAKAICGSCAVKKECLNFALSNRELYGIWGGLNENERKRLFGAQANIA